MIAILRVFLIDSMAFDAALGARNLKPDAIDILPGLMPSMIRKVRQMTAWQRSVFTWNRMRTMLLCSKQ